MKPLALVQPPIFFDPRRGRVQVWSCGGGTQSAAIAVLIATGVLPTPDLAVMVDTEREKSPTFPYLRKYIAPALAAVGVVVEVVGKSRFTGVDLTSRDGQEILLPAYTTATGTIGKLPAFCSGEWKRDVVNRWLRSKGIDQCDTWIGFSLDEMRKRVAEDRRKWRRNLYPLIDCRMHRADCVRVVTDYGWPEPPRSACWMCSNMSNEEWAKQKLEEPADFAKAVAMDAWLRKGDPDLWIHASCKPLGEVNFAKDEAGLFGAPCPSGSCFT